MPNSLLEAMAMGIPAVAFAIPPIREIEAGTGGVVMVPFLDTAAFSQEIMKLAASPDERERIAKIGKAQVMNRFSLRNNMAEVVRMLSLLINTRRFRDRRPNSGRLADVSRHDGI